MTDGMFIIHLLTLMFGLVFGSFLNVVIYRLPRGESLVRPRSRCPHCKEPIAWYDNIPVLSYVLLRGHCRHCSDTISLRYPLVEMVSAILLWWPVVTMGFGPEALISGFFSLLLLVIALIDIDTKTIPDGLIVAGILGGALAVLLGKLSDWAASLLGIMVVGGGLLAILLIGDFVLKKPSMGFGDVKLAAVVGLFLGWKLGLLAMFLAFLSASIVGIPALLFKKLAIGQRLPFGPFISLGTIVSMYWGTELIAIYLRFMYV